MVLRSILPQRREDWASLFIVCIAACIGLPLWWLTTTVKRVSLPLDEIRAFEEIPEGRYYDTEKEKTMLIPIATSVQVMFILAIAEPKRAHTKWLSASIVQEVLAPVSDLLRPVINIIFTSKTMYYIDAKANKLPLSTLGISSLVTNVENNLGSVLSSSPILHAVLYIPNNNVSMPVAEKSSTSVPNNLVVLPRWGAIKIPTDSKCRDADSFDRCEVDAYFNELLPEIFALIGLPVSSENFPRPLLGLWSRDDFKHSLEKLTLRYLGSAISSLKSLTFLLQKIRSIVINDEVAANVKLSVEKAKQAELLLKNGQLFEAAKISSSAFNYAESAFFDPSILELLYFPDDQKFAIYIPLFLPIGLPIVMAVLTAVKNLVAKKKTVSEASPELKIKTE